jgi:hypothetical protein
MSDHSEQLFEQDYARIGYMIRCAFEKTNISQDRHYYECFEQYMSNESFRSAFDRIISGMGLSVVPIPDIGLLFGVRDEKTPFSASVYDLKLNWKLEQRALIAVCMVGVASFFFKDGFSEGLRKEASLRDIVIRTKELIKEKRENGSESEEESKVWEKIEDASVIGYTKKQKHPAKGGLEWAVLQALEFFVDNQFLHRKKVEGENLYTPKRRFRSYVEQHGLDELEALLEI